MSAIRSDLTDAEFDRTALSLLRFQSEANPVYRRFVLGLGLDPDRLGQWREFPALPAAAFRDQAVVTFPSDQATLVFETSGTTAAQTGKHYVADPRYYEKALLEGFRLFLPDLCGHRWVSLIPRFEELPHSSLAYMIRHLGRNIPQTEPEYFCDGKYRMDWDGLRQSLSCDMDRPVALFGTSFALASAAEHFLEQTMQWQLPEESVVFDTGGYKGRRKELACEDLADLIGRAFGIHPQRIYNEYGMTELSSQGYACLDEGIHRFPPWLKAVIRDPRTGKACEPGEMGLVQFYDLANVGSVMALGTLDLAVEKGNGIRLMGRMPASELRGCSLPYEA
ncbi:MAG: hypothetical protein PHD76_03435 [Methylacidiphilales bacterium]|nr:hypothetical protein [Candidatus Methylacidiphilales bacterium]